ncbi:YtkA-like [Roseivivax lentus]|uniref:YtkA-like n=1 Tax=Roseivivax lentus TaxID=633194 RepID=A0A1N7PCB0_9RHOB|nr:FixH family protein [Roseivivax lentus]SIT08265.1 YtkA-like [Roseivivax lentus]
MFRLKLAILACLATPALGDRLLAEATCAPTDTEMQFNCEISLSEGGVPVEGAAFTVKPDMRSMPMAHNIPPVASKATESPGIYSVRLDLQMLGDWTLTLDLTEPRRDRVILRHTFDETTLDHPSMDHSSQGASH